MPKTDVAEVATPVPTHSRVSYGKDPARFVDVYLAKSDQPTPVIIYIHGGGWTAGSAEGITRTDVFGAHNKHGEGVQEVLDCGISVVSVEYRFINAAMKAGAKPPVEWPLRDAALAVQFVRSMGNEWNLDKQQVGLTGSSAGGCSSLWLAMHPDMADPQSADPVARESTRPAFVGVLNAQTSLDPLQLKLVQGGTLRSACIRVLQGSQALGGEYGRLPRGAGRDSSLDSGILSHRFGQRR